MFDARYHKMILLGTLGITHKKPSAPVNMYLSFFIFSISGFIEGEKRVIMGEISSFKHIGLRFINER